VVKIGENNGHFVKFHSSLCAYVELIWLATYVTVEEKIYRKKDVGKRETCFGNAFPQVIRVSRQLNNCDSYAVSHNSEAA
jgi:hypothetical protein